MQIKFIQKVDLTKVSKLNVSVLKRNIIIFGSKRLLEKGKWICQLVK